jgi:peptidoglycan/LPS O-acetylase OafA/YrhL
MFHHLVDGDAAGSRVARGLAAVCHAGWAGVDLFFVLSGFLITGILLDSKPRHYFRNFYMRRTLRIFPLYYGVLAIIFVIAPLSVRSPSPSLRSLWHNQAWFWLYGSDLLASLSGAHAMQGGSVSLFHFWSLAVEEHFYLVWPAVVLLCPPGRKFSILCVALAITVLAARLICMRSGVNAFALYTFTPLRVDGLVLGALGANLVRGPGGIPALTRPASVLLALSGASLVLLFACRSASAETSVVAGRAQFFTPLSVCFACCIVLAVAAEQGTHPFARRTSRLIAHPILLAFGKYSYGLYVLQALLQPTFERLFSTHILRQWLHSYVLAGLLHLLLSVASSFLAACLSFHFLERPILRLKRFFPSGRALPRREPQAELIKA